MSMLQKYMKLQEDIELKYGKNSVVLYMKGSFYELYSLDIDKKLELSKSKKSFTKKSKSI